MEVKIGIQSIPRELVFESDATAEEVERDLTAALAAKDGKGIFALSTSKSGRVLSQRENKINATAKELKKIETKEEKLK